MNIKKSKYILLSLVSAIVVSGFAGCADSESSSEASGSSNASGDQSTTESATLLQMPLEFGYQSGSVSDDDESSNLDAQDPTSPDSENSDGYETVTDANGEPVTEYVDVTDANGEVVTTYVDVTNADGETQTDADGEVETTAVPVTTSVAVTKPAGESSGSSYTPYIDKAYAMWVDISDFKDYIFNDQFISITFKVNENAPDGAYDIKFTETQFSSIVDAGTSVIPDNIFDGKVFVSTDAEKQPEIPTDGFTVYGDYASCKQGDEITVNFNFKNNPGMVGMLIWFEYDRKALDIVSMKATGEFEDISTASFGKAPETTSAAE